MPKYLKLLFFALILITLASCSSDNEQIDESLGENQKDSIVIPESPLINYKLCKIENRATIDSILAAVPDSVDKAIARKILMTLNRKEFRFIRNGDSIIVPEIFTNNLLDYAIFPQFYPAAKGLDKIIMVCIINQAYACYDHGKLVRFAAVNSGKERTPSFPGRYALVWKDRLRKSSLDSTWILPFTFNFHNEAGSAFHQFEMPGRPVSHSCLRQFLDDAEWLFKWGRGVSRDTANKPIPMTGTPVILLGHFDYTRPRGGPWLDFTSNKDGMVELPEKPMEVEEALIPIIQIPETSRGVLRNRQRYVYAEDTLRARGIIRESITLTPSIDFNKQRRLKKAAEAKRKLEEEKKKLNEEVAAPTNTNSLD